MRCDEIMKQNVECAMPEDSVEDAACKMRDHNLGFLPICDDAGRVLGALTDRDIAIRVVAEGKPNSTRVEEVMTPDVVATKPEDNLETAEQLMAKHHKSRMMCIDSDGRLAGVISLSDIAQHHQQAASDTLREVSAREARA